MPGLSPGPRHRLFLLPQGASPLAADGDHRRTPLHYCAIFGHLACAKAVLESAAAAAAAAAGPGAQEPGSSGRAIRCVRCALVCLAWAKAAACRTERHPVLPWCRMHLARSSAAACALLTRVGKDGAGAREAPRCQQSCALSHPHTFASCTFPPSDPPLSRPGPLPLCAAPPPLDISALLEARCGSGCTALHLAVYYGHPLIVELLLKHGADMRAQAEARSGQWWRKKRGATALHLAAHSGDVPAAVAILRHMVGGRAWVREGWGGASRRIGGAGPAS